MATAFNLTAQINLRGPSNIKPIVADIKRQLGTVSANVKVNLDARSAKSIDNITSRLRVMNSVLTETRNHVQAVNQSFATLTSSLSTVQSATRGISSGVTSANQSLRDTSKNVKIARTEMEEFGKQSYLAIKRFAAFSFVTTGIFALTNAVNSGLKAFINFDRELVRLQQVSGKSSIGIAGLEKQITGLSTSLGVSSEKLMQVATTLAQAGFSVNDTTIALQALAKTDLAPSFDDLTETTEGAIAAMRQFGLQAKDLEASLGSINAVAAAFAVESSDIITAIQRTGGVFAAASKGVTEGKDALNEFIAVFTSVRATTRESAETIATGLRTIFTRIQRAKTIDQLREFGIELQDVEGKFVGPYEAVKRLSEALNKLDPRDVRFSTIVEELGGFRQIGKVIPLIQQFSTAQQALGVAQRGQSSLTDAQIAAQQSLANQLAKVREQFLALIRDIGKSTAFQGLFKVVTGLASGLIGLAGAFKPILPLLAVMGVVKGVSALRQFGSGFFGSMKSGGGAKAVGENIGSSLTGNRDTTEATSRASEAIRSNTSALNQLTVAVQSLTNRLGTRSAGLNSGGMVKQFATGGYVPGSGNRDTVPAMLTPGEFVIRKKAVETIGAGNLHRLNKYAAGGIIKEDKIGYVIGEPDIGSQNTTVTITQGEYNEFLTGKSTRPKELRMSQGLQNIPGGVLGSSQLGSFISELNIPNINVIDNASRGKKYDVIAQGLNSGTQNINIDQIIRENLYNAIANASRSITGLEPPAEQLQAAMAGLNEGMLGNLYESIISASTPGDSSSLFELTTSAQRPFDFTNGLGSAYASLYPNLNNIQYIEAKKTWAGYKSDKENNKIKPAIYGQLAQEAVRSFEQQIGSSSKEETINAIRSHIISKNIAGPKSSTAIADTLGVGKKNTRALIQTLLDNSIIYSSGKDLYDIAKKNSGGLIQRFANGGMINTASIDAKTAKEQLGRYIGKSRDGKSSYWQFVPGMDEIIQIVENERLVFYGPEKLGFKVLKNRRAGGRSGSPYEIQEAPSQGSWTEGFFAGGPIRKFAQGGSAEDTVPALLTPGEFVINKNAAKNIGYARLHQLNKADKIQGYNRGGVVGNIQKFASGGTAQQQIVSYKQSRENEQNRLDTLRQQASTASGAARVVLDEEIKKSESKINELTSKIDAVINSYDILEQNIAKSGQDLYAANELLVQKAKQQYEASSGGKKWEDLSDKSREKIVKKARAGRYLDSSGTDMFQEENAAILEAQQKLARSKKKQGTRFADTKSSEQLRETSLTPSEVQNRKKADEAMIDYKARQQGTSSADYKYQLTQKLGQKAYETTEMYAGRKEEMKAELVTRQDRFKNIGATIASAQAAAAGSGPEAEAARTQLADANSRLASETENIAQQMRDLNPTLDMDSVSSAAREVAKLLSEGKLEEAQKAMVEALGEAPDATTSMNIAMEKLARDLNIDIGTLRRTFAEEGDKKLLDRQQFIQSREGQRFGSLAEFAPDWTKKFSDSKLGGMFGRGADFISGKGGKASQFFANKLGGISGVGAAVTVGAETLKQFLPKSVTSNPNAAGVLGGLSGAGSGAAMGAQLGMFAGPIGALIGGVGGAIVGGIQGFFSSQNQAILTNAIENVAKTTGDLDMAFKKLEQSANDTNFSNAQKAFGDVITSGKDIEGMAMSEPASVAGTAMGAAAGAAMGAALGTIIPGIGTAIGAGIGALAGGAMAYFSAPSAEQRKEAMGAMVQQSGANQQSATRLAQIQLKKTSTADLDKMLDNLDKVSGSMSLVTQQYSDGMIKAAEAANGTANLTNAEKERITVEAQARSALDAYMQKRKQSGATDEQITKEIEKDRNAAIKEGEEKLKADNELLVKQEAMARAIRIVAVESERLLDVYKRVGGAIDKMTFNINELANQADAFSDTITGQGKVEGPNRKQENILTNYSNYSMAEVEKAAADAANLMGGGKGASEMTNSVVASKIIEDQLPALLRETSGQDTDEVIAVLRDRLGPVFGKDSKVLDDALSQIDERLKSQGEDKSYKELSSEELVKELSNTLKAGAETTGKVIKAWNDGIQEAANLTNKYNQAILQSEQYIREANTIRINAENDLAKALGKSLSLDQLNKAFNEEVLSLTKGIGPGGAGTLDPKLISKFIQSETQAVEDRKTQFNEGGLGGNTEQAVQKQKEYNEAQAKSQRAIKNASAALDKLASDGTTAANALSAIQERVALSGRATDFVTKLATSEGTELADTIVDLDSYTRAASGQATEQDYGNLAFRQQAFRGLDTISPLLGQGMGERVKAKMNLDMLEKTNPALLDKKIGISQDKDGNLVEMTIRDALMQQAEGKADAATQSLIDTYNAATEAQTTALLEKAELQQQSADKMQKTLEDIYKELTKTLDKLVDRSQEEVKKDADSLKQVRQTQLIDEFSSVAGLSGLNKAGKTPEEIIDMIRASGELDKADQLQGLLSKIYSSGTFDHNDLARMWTDPNSRPKPKTPEKDESTEKENKENKEKPQAGAGSYTMPRNPGVGVGAVPNPPLRPGVGIGSTPTVPLRPGIGIGSPNVPSGDRGVQGYEGEIAVPGGVMPPSPEVVDPLQRIGNMADQASQPGSIYTHDIHLESILTAIKDSLSQNNQIYDMTNLLKQASSPASSALGGGLSSVESVYSTFKDMLKSLITVNNTNKNAQAVFSQNTTTQQSSNNPMNTISLDEKSIKTLDNFVGKFGEYVNQLSQFNLPSKVEIKGTFSMDVNLTGSEAFQAMGVNLKNEIIDIFEPQLDYIWQRTNGALTRRPSISKTNKTTRR